jgi:hypothetical protein
VVAAPPDAWLQTHRWPLMAALIPCCICDVVELPPADRGRFCKRLHFQLALETAERLRRRQVLIETAAVQGGGSRGATAETTRTPSGGGGLPRACVLVADRQLSPQSLREVEIRRRASCLAVEAPSLASSSSSSVPSVPLPVTASVPLLGRQRARWLRARLVQLLQEDTEVCPVTAGSTAATLLALFEHVTAELFSEAPGAPVTSRIRSFAKVLGNVTREVVFTPPLQSVERNMYRRWNRAPRVRVDVDHWRQEEQRRDAAGPCAVRVRPAMAEADAGLASWLRGHRYLVPTAVEQGEAGMALLLLWEVDHGQPFPTGVAGDSTTATLASFSRRLRLRVAQDDELSSWLEVKEMQFPLAPGLPASHQLRWSVRVQRPGAGEASGWYDDFVARWRAYLETLLIAPERSRPTVQAPGERPQKKQRAGPARRGSVELPGDGGAVPSAPGERMAIDQAQQVVGGRLVRGRSPIAEPATRTKRTRMDLRGWLQPRQPGETSASAADPASSQDVTVRSGHGRATAGDPT